MMAVQEGNYFQVKVLLSYFIHFHVVTSLCTSNCRVCLFVVFVFFVVNGDNMIMIMRHTLFRFTNLYIK